MNTPQAVASNLEIIFNRILHEQMAGLPLLNPKLEVKTLGFQVYEGRIIGILVTPWMMSLLMLPREDDDWNELEVGKKQLHQFPAKNCKFMINEIDGLGKCQTHSLYSPMNQFRNQVHAMAAAKRCLDDLMTVVETTPEDAVDEELLGRILRGEETPEIDFGEKDDDTANLTTGVERVKTQSIVEKRLTRREVLRGDFVRGA